MDRPAGSLPRLSELGASLFAHEVPPSVVQSPRAMVAAPYGLFSRRAMLTLPPSNKRKIADPILEMPPEPPPVEPEPLPEPEPEPELEPEPSTLLRPVGTLSLQALFASSIESNPEIDLIPEEDPLIDRGRKPKDKRVYRMRGHDTNLNETVFWNAPELDVIGKHYKGPGPITDIVVQGTQRR